MAEDSEGDVFAVDDFQEFAGAVAELVLILVGGPGIAVGCEEALHYDGVDGEENWAGVGKADEDRLVAGDVSTGFNEAKAGEQVCVAIDEGVAKGWMVPVGTGESEAGVTGAGDFIVGALDDEFGIGKRIVEAGMVDIEVGADNGVDLGRRDVEGG